jgi:hypothetical protein
MALTATASEAEKAPPGPPPPTGAWLLPAYLVGLAFVFVGERVVTSDSSRYAFTGLGVLATIATTGLRFARSGSGGGERGRAERALAFFSAGGVFALGVYFATTETGRGLIGLASAKPETRARVEGMLTAGFVGLLVLSVFPLILGEIALAPMRRAAMIETRRVRSALRSGLILGAAAIYCALFTYSTGELDLKVDYSYFRTARPSESTKKIAAAAGEPIVVKAFFPQLNEVGTEVLGYLREAARDSQNLKVEEYDRLLVPNVAKEAKVTSDGVVVLTRGATRETLTIGVDMKTAANKLKTLDGDFQKSLLKVMHEAHVAYVTVGHGELTETRTDVTDGHSAKGLRKLFESQNYIVKDLGLTQGLGTDVPADATVVVVCGPSQALLPEEVAALKAYADRGGHLLLALDPEAKVDLAPLAGIVGLTWSPTVLANDKTFVRRRHNNGDRVNLATNRFSSHASVSTLSRNSARMPVVFPGVSTLEKAPGNALPDLKVDFTVKALPETFEDKNGTFEFDASSEKRTTWNLAAAVSRNVPAPAGWKSKDPPEMRAFVIADADVLSDAAFGNEPNIFFAADIVRWLGGEESFSGAITNTEDVRIEHTKQKDVLWFYATILGAPGAVLALGLLIARRPRRAATKRAAASSAAATSAAASKEKRA